MSTINNHATDGVLAKIGKSRVTRLSDMKEAEKEKLPALVTPTKKDAKVIMVQPASSALKPIRKNTKRDKLLLLGLKGAYHEDFNSEANGKLSTIGFWKGAFDDVGLGFVIEEHPVKDSKPRLFCYYTFPEGVNALLYRDGKTKAKKEEKAEKPAAKEKPAPAKKAS
jgi:hypothetical protein